MTHFNTAYEWLATLPILPVVATTALFALMGAMLYLVAGMVRVLNLIEAMLTVINAEGEVVRTGFEFIGAGLNLLRAQNEVVRTSLNVLDVKMNVLVDYVDRRPAPEAAPTTPPDRNNGQLSLDLPQSAAILPFRPEPPSNGSGRTT